MESLLKTLFNHWIVLIVLIGAVFILLASVAEEVRKYACHRNEIELKRDLAERGMSADEIERIVAAKVKNTKSA
jgi:hypothetical protein